MTDFYKPGFLSLIMMLTTHTIYANEKARQTSVTAIDPVTQHVEQTTVSGAYSDKDSNNTDSTTKQRFIPVELFTGAKWDGKHELKMESVVSSSCALSNGRGCITFHVSGPFKTERNDTKIAWAGDEISYYRRTFSTRRMGEIVSFFTINQSKDGLVRIYDKRKQWGERTYNGLGSKFPLGYWNQGEVRSYPSRKPTRIEIIELYGPDDCLTFRWVK